MVMTRGGAVSTVTKIRAGETRNKVRFPTGEIFLTSPKLQDGLLRPPSLLIGTESSLPRGKKAKS